MLKLSSYDNFLFKDISFSLEKGDNLVILGSNGAGKTTLAKVLSGIIENDNVNIEGHKLCKLWGKDRSKRINYIPTKLEIFDEYLSVGEFLSLSHFKKDIAIETVLEKLDILYLNDKSCKDLSSGESQLVLIASSILQGSEFTIFDEIVSNLDPQRQKQIFGLFKNGDHLSSKIIITHNLDFAYKLGFDILFMQKGKIIFEGSNEEFFDQKNLDTIFQNSVKKYENHIVVDL